MHLPDIPRLLDTPPFDRAFFAQPTLQVARALLGQWLMIQHDSDHPPIVTRIVETEAYTQDDPACHAFKGPTPRAKSLFGPPGLAYVYLIYGMYHCLNVVTAPTGEGGAVLFRALEPVFHPQHPTGFETLKPAQSPLQTHGPGRLCKALGITKALHNELDMTHPQSPLRLLPSGNHLPDKAVMITTRIGISKATDYPWRFYVKDNRWVSVP